MILTIATSAVPVALIPLESCAEVLGVQPGQAREWAESGLLVATYYQRRWWVSVSDLTTFVERSHWQLVAPPMPGGVQHKPVRGRRKLS